MTSSSVEEMFLRVMDQLHNLSDRVTALEYETYRLQVQIDVLQEDVAYLQPGLGM